MRLIDGDALIAWIKESQQMTSKMKAVIAKINIMPSADIDLSEYSDKLWRNAYERGKADRPQGEWKLDSNGMDWNIPAWRCTRCGYVANYIGVEANGLGNNPMNWAGSKYCPNCGARMFAKDTNVLNKESADENLLAGIQPKPIPTKKHTFVYQKGADDDSTL